MFQSWIRCNEVHFFNWCLMLVSMVNNQTIMVLRWLPTKNSQISSKSAIITNHNPENIILLENTLSPHFTNDLAYSVLFCRCSRAFLRFNGSSWSTKGWKSRFKTASKAILKRLFKVPSNWKCKVEHEKRKSWKLKIEN